MAYNYTNPFINWQYNPVPNYIPTHPQSNGIIWVQGEAGAKAYPVASGQNVILMDSEASAFYIKSTDQNGIPMPLRVFDYVERKPTIESSKPITDEYVTKEDLKKFMDEIKFTINERNNYHKKPQNKE